MTRYEEIHLADLAAIAAADHVVDMLQAGHEDLAHDMRCMAIDMVAAVAPYGSTSAIEVVDAAVVTTIEAQSSLLPGMDADDRLVSYLSRKWERVKQRELIEIPDFDTI